MSRRQNTFRIFGYCILLLEDPPAGIHSIPMATKKRVLFLCTGNSCRSQMAEGWLRHLAGDRFEVFSAGTKPVGLNPLAVDVMREAGVDISHHSSKHVSECFSQQFPYVITVCDSAAESCPIFPG